LTDIKYLREKLEIIKRRYMLDISMLLRLMRIKEDSRVSGISWILRLIFIFPLIFLVSPQNIFTYKTILIFSGNFFLTAFIFAINDVEDAEDDNQTLEKRKRNPISSGDLTKTQGYLISFLLLLIGLSLLLIISPLVFFVGLVLTSVGFFYSWKPVRLKSIPIVDLISHVICLGLLQFSTTYLTFRPLDLLFIPFLMIIIPISFVTDIFQELRDFKVDKKMKINNTIQRLGRFNIKKLLIISSLIVITGFLIIFFIIPLEYSTIILSLSVFLGIIVVLRQNKIGQVQHLA